MNGRSQMLRFTPTILIFVPSPENKKLSYFSELFFLLLTTNRLKGIAFWQVWVNVRDSKLESKPTKCSSAAMNGAVSPPPQLHRSCVEFSAFACMEGSTFCVYFLMFQDSL